MLKRVAGTDVKGSGSFSCRYIELNPIHARMTADPFDYTWLNNALNAFARDDPLIHPHFAYMALTSTDEERHDAYRAIAMETVPRSSRRHPR